MPADVLVPESEEIIEQITDNLIGAYLRAGTKTAAGVAARVEMHETIGWLVDNPERCLRVALLMGVVMTDRVRPRFDLSNPDSGVFLENTSGADPEEGEIAASAFVNALLHGDRDQAVAVFCDLVDTGIAEEVGLFMAVLVAMSIV